MTPLWWLTKDGDLDCIELYERHYSCYRYADGRERKQFVGPGEKVVLRTERADAIFVWRNFIDDSGQEGVNCAVFRNESPYRSSLLIQQADSIADALWPDCRHYTYVNSEAIRSSNPGFCFLKAGWRRCGRTKGGLIVLERRHETHYENGTEGALCHEKRATETSNIREHVTCQRCIALLRRAKQPHQQGAER